MKTSIKFLLVFVMIAASFVLLIRLGYKASDWTFWLVLIMLPTAGFIIGKTDFRSPE